MTVTELVIHLAKRKGVIGASDLATQGIHRHHLYRLHQVGLLERVGRGLYVLTDADVTEHHTSAEVARRVPHGVLCLLTALRFHDLTTQAPFEVWLAIEHKARSPKAETIPIRIAYMSGRAFYEGVETHDVEGVSVRVYSAAKTVADCFKYRNKIGLDVAIEALRDYRGSAVFDVDALWHFAGICRVEKVVRPYLEAISYRRG